MSHPSGPSAEGESLSARLARPRPAPSAPGRPLRTPGPAGPARRTPISRLADGTGLTAAGATLVVATVSLLGALLDLLGGGGLGTAFGVCFVLGCVAAAPLAHPEDRAAAVFMPPLVYLAMALLAGLTGGSGVAGGVATRVALSVVNTLVLDAPVLLLGTGLSLVLVLLRRHRGRRQPA